MNVEWKKNSSLSDAIILARAGAGMWKYIYTMGKLTFDCALLILVNRIYDEYLSKNRMNLDNIGILFSHEWVIKKKLWIQCFIQILRLRGILKNNLIRLIT